MKRGPRVRQVKAGGLGPTSAKDAESFHLAVLRAIVRLPRPPGRAARREAARAAERRMDYGTATSADYDAAARYFAERLAPGRLGQRDIAFWRRSLLLYTAACIEAGEPLHPKLAAFVAAEIRRYLCPGPARGRPRSGPHSKREK